MENLRFLTDEELIHRFQQGENPAFETLIGRYKDSLYTYIYILLRNKETAEDILQDTLMKVMITIRNGRYIESGKFQSWLTRIAHNRIIDYYRFEKEELKISNDALSQDIFNNSRFSEETFEQKLVKQQICSNVKKMIRFLPANQQEIVLLRYYRGLSFKEIAKLTGVSINTALGRMRYAVLNMRKMIQQNQALVSI